MSNKLEVRERILKTADTLFHRQGYNATGINQIIKEAEVAKASLYYHFATKNDLCVAFLQERHQLWSASFETFLNGKGDKILAAFDFIIADNEANNYRGCSFLNQLSETPPEENEIFNELQMHKKALLAFFETELVDRHEDLAYTIYSLFENAILEGQLFRQQAPVIRLRKIAARLLA